MNKLQELELKKKELISALDKEIKEEEENIVFKRFGLKVGGLVKTAKGKFYKITDFTVSRIGGVHPTSIFGHVLIDNEFSDGTYLIHGTIDTLTILNGEQNVQ